VKRRTLGTVAVIMLAVLAALWAASYFALGVDPRFLIGLARAAVAGPRTPAEVEVPAGVTAAVWAEGLTAPTSLAFGPDGRLYVAELSGQVVALADLDGNGAADPGVRVVYARGLSVPLGLAFYASDLYVGRHGGVSRLRDTDGDGVAEVSETVVEGLPATRHQTDGLAFGPDGRLYIGQGSTSDRGETGVVDREASILVVERDGSDLRVFASGTRNPYDLAFFPGTDLLFATDNGRDVPTTGVPDELNLIVDGGDYGWPGCWGAARGPACAGTLSPVAELPAHAAAGGLVFYTGDLFPQWREHAFITLYGSNSGDPTIGRSVVRVELAESEGAWTGTVHDFAEGFDRPLDVTVGPDGALYVADFGAGIIYRLAGE
jgi:glucose/arabinose dehydrogenase